MNPTMSEILHEDPNGPMSFLGAVRQKIHALCTRLKISLVVFDKLMALVNTLGGATWWTLQINLFRTPFNK